MTTIDDRTILITGATDGLGRALAEHLAGKGATLLLHGRDEAKGHRCLAEISKASGNDRLEWYQADFADLNQVETMAEEIRNRHMRLDVLISNAGIGAHTLDGHNPSKYEREQSIQGHELRFAVNYLAGFALIHALYPLLNQTAKLESARIISISSAGQAPIDFNDPMLCNNYDGVHAYCQSKLAQIMMTFDLAERCSDTNVAAVALHPSTYMATKIVETPISSVQDGVNATAALVNAPLLSVINNKYFNVKNEAVAHQQAYDLNARARLRDLSEQLTGF